MAIELAPRVEPIYGYDDEGYLVSDGLPMAEHDIHRELMLYSINALDLFFDQPDIYVSGNNFIHYREGDRTRYVSPDCYVVFGVEKRLRDNFKIWQEGGHRPAVVFEFTSRKTRKEDEEVKFPL